MTKPVPSMSPPTTPQPARSAYLKPPRQQGKAVCIYGPGGIGKTSLVSLLDGVAWFDLDESLADLGKTDAQCAPCTTYQEIMDTLKGSALNDSRVIAIDSGTRLEELSVKYVIGHVPHEKGNTIRCIEDYGWGKGYGHVFNAYMDILNALQEHRRNGRHVVLVCHDCTAHFPNPQGDDWIRYEPRLQNPESGKNSIRLRMREWVSELYCICYDILVKDGRAQGTGTRTIYPVEAPHCMAKSKTFDRPFVCTEGEDGLWKELGMK